MLQTIGGSIGVALGPAVANASSTLAVQTDDTTNVTSDGATLNTTLTDMGGNYSVWVYFEYGESGTLDQTTSGDWRYETGSWSIDVSDLDPNTTYDVRAVAEGDDETVRGSTQSFTTPDPNPSISVSTGDPLSVSHCATALWGSLDEAIDVSSVDVTFEWREDGASTWNTTRTELLDSTASIRHYVDGLAAGTTYEYRLTATADSDVSDTGSIVTVTTDDTTTLKGETNTATDVTDTTAVLNATLDSFGDGSSTDVLFRWGPEAPSGDFPANTTLEDTLSTTGSYSAEVTGLDPGTTYEYWVALNDGMDVHRGHRLAFTTPGPQLDVTSDTATDVFDTGATLQGTLESLGEADSADVHFEYRPTGSSTWTSTAVQTRTNTGSFTADLTGLAETTEYEFRALSTASDGDTDTGESVTFTTTGDPVVTTEEATNVEDTEATLAGAIQTEGGADTHTVSFEWGPAGDLSNTATDVFYDSLNPYVFYADVSGLDPETTYDYRALIDASDGESDAGDVRSLTTTQPTDDNVAVSTSTPTNVDDSSATLQGSLDDLGGADSADLSFEYREAATDAATETSTRTLTATGDFSADVTGLSPDTSYEFRALASASDGDVDATAWATFTTDTSDGTAPTVDSLSVTTADKNDPHAKLTVDWSVSDVDGNLDTVTVDVYDGILVDSSTTDVFGGTASGTDVFEIKHGGGDTYDVEATVTDTDNRTDSQRTTVTAA